MKTRQRRTNKRAQKRRNNEAKKMSANDKTTVAMLTQRMVGTGGGKFGIHAFFPKKTKVKGYQRDQKGQVIKTI